MNTMTTAAWRQQMDDNLRAENSWLALAGLFWLQQGVNACGTAAFAAIQLPAGDYPAHMGDFVLEPDGRVTLHLAPGVDGVRVDGQTVQQALLQPDSSGQPTWVTLGQLSFIVIQRESEYAIRLWDNGRAARQTFIGRHWFPIQPAYELGAHYYPYPTPVELPIANSVGQELAMQASGYVSFTLNGHPQRLEASRTATGELFIIFKDETSGRDTYGAGRYLTLPAPTAAGDVKLDFNRAYHPPCAFTPYATCPYPPRQNQLATAVEAGEKTAVTPAF